MANALEQVEHLITMLLNHLGDGKQTELCTSSMVSLLNHLGDGKPPV